MIVTHSHINVTHSHINMHFFVQVQTESAKDVSKPVQETIGEEALLEQAMSMSENPEKETPIPDFASMTEEDQIAYALQMSMSGRYLTTLFNSLILFLMLFNGGAQRNR